VLINLVYLVLPENFPFIGDLQDSKTKMAQIPQDQSSRICFIVS